MSKKELHKHSLPIALVVTGAILMLVVFMSQINTKGSSDRPIEKALTTQFLDIRPSANGLVSISRSGVNVSERPTTDLTAYSSVGEVARLQVVLNSLTEE